jgi:hypothetical protein
LHAPAALEFSAKIGKWQLNGVVLIRFGEVGEMVEFEVMVQPVKALARKWQAGSARNKAC